MRRLLASVVFLSAGAGWIACSSFDAEADDAPDGAVAESGGADGATGSDTGDGGSAVGDATPCSARVDKGFVCADFETDEVYQSGFPITPAPHPSRTFRAPGSGSSRAMWGDGLAEMAKSIDINADTPIVAGRVELDFWVEAYGSGTPKTGGALVRFAVNPQCYIDVVLGAPPILQTHCGYGTVDPDGGKDLDYYTYKPILSGLLPIRRWTHIVLDVDYSKSTAAVTFDGAARTEISLNPVAIAGGKPYLNFGAVIGASFAIDNVLATVRTR